ncbi:MAG: energy-coupling factor transporter ATPase [Clostridia bacterium]|nr:energy-coupling factor transporter ATPase [Clostridia bacterium]
MLCNPIIKIENIFFSYDSDEEDGQVVKKEVLRGISLEIERGSFVAIVGPNGSGKSTLAKHLNALLLPTDGDVYVDGINTKTDDPLEIRSKVGMVFQNPDNQLVSSIVEDDVAFGPENLGVEPTEIRRRVDDSLKRVSMYEFRKKGPHLLSGGQKQRVAIAGTLAMGTDCIVFDEPTAMLDPSGRKEIMDIINDLHREGKTVILITHFMEEAAQTDRIIVVNKGQIYADAAPKDLFTGETADKLAEISLTPPFAAKLANDLRKNGIDIPNDIYTEEVLADYLCKLK